VEALVVRVSAGVRSVQVSAAAAPPPPAEWFYRDPRGVEQGPVAASRLLAWRSAGQLPRDLPVRREGGA